MSVYILEIDVLVDLIMDLMLLHDDSASLIFDHIERLRLLEEKYAQ